ncbi:MAG: NusA-like transcription termination signal-binding factor [archaeon]
MIKLSSEEIKYIGLFEKETGTLVKDCILQNDNEITFLVKEGQIGLALGKKGEKIKKIKQLLGKEIHVYEHSEDPQKFVANLFYPIKVEKIDIKTDEIIIYVDPNEKKRAIGGGGKKIKAVREIINRHLGIDKITVQ